MARENDLKTLPTDAVEELLDADPDWCTLGGVRRDVKRVNEGPVWSNIGRQLKRAMEEVKLERKTARESLSASVNFVGANDGNH